jgi:hypothetical protein
VILLHFSNSDDLRIWCRSSETAFASFHRDHDRLVPRDISQVVIEIETDPVFPFDHVRNGFSWAYSDQQLLGVHDFLCHERKFIGYCGIIGFVDTFEKFEKLILSLFITFIFLSIIGIKIKV